MVNPTPPAVTNAQKFGLYVRTNYQRFKNAVQKLWQRWRDNPVKTTGYGVIAAIVAYFAAEGIVDSNVTNLVTSLVTLGAGAPVVHAVNNQVASNVQAARLQGRMEARAED